MYCIRCGSQIEEGARYCPRCGAAQDNAQQPYQYQQPPYQHDDYDSGSIGWGFLGFFLPIVGLILFLVWRKDKPKSAKQAGIGALIGAILEAVPVIIFIFLFILAVGLAPTVPNDYYAITSLLTFLI